MHAIGSFRPPGPRGGREGMWFMLPLLWILVIPGLVRDRQPLFNEREPVWHHPGYVLPLAEVLRG